MIGTKHLIECHCILPVYKDVSPPVYHKFSVYSKMNESGKVIPKYTTCNNCGITHLVHEICRSDIKVGSEDASSIRSLEDISVSLPKDLTDILKRHECDISTYELIEDVIDNEIFPYEVILQREIIDEEHSIKILEIKSINSFKIKTEKIKTIIR